MKLNTHDRTPKPENNKIIILLFIISGVLIYSIFGLCAFACFFYGKSFVGGISVILIPVFLTAIMLITFKDIEKAYIEINEREICVVDYYWGIKKEKHISICDITSAEICSGYSHKVKGYRLSAAGIHYIVFRKDSKYLFKIIYLPETKKLFEKYIKA